MTTEAPARPKVRQRPAAVILTPSAEARIAKLMASAPEGAIGVKLSTPRRGCSGLAYSVDYVEAANPMDERIETPGGTFFIDGGSVLYLIGSTMDWQEDDFTAGFVFENPNAKVILRLRGKLHGLTGVATPIAELRARIAAQRTDNPAMYGAVDFAIHPERLLLDGNIAGSELRTYPKVAAKLLEDRALMERMGAYTMMGDALADPYAALMPEYGFKRLVDMLVDACDKGLEKVDGAPPELVTFIRSMEATPAWVNMPMVEEGARLQRVTFANVAPWAIRGAFIATFMNKYAALPMALTGTLSNKTAARRIKETATFFGTSVLPGALARFGPGFKAAAMVRLMHSMVRFNVLSNGKWDQTVYGIPIPQVDQMPAGLISDFLISSKVLKEGRSDFTPEERAQIELSRYRCFLLGLPADLLAETPQGIVDAWNARALSLRAGFDEATCGGLLRATMEADLIDTTTPQGQMRARLERSFAKVYFMQNFCDGSEKAAARFGVKIRAIDRMRAAAVGVGLMGQMRLYGVAAKTPVVRHLADQRLVGKVRGYLGSLGHAEFTTDATKYKPAA